MLELGPALSVTVSPLTKQAGGDVRRAIERAGKLGMRFVQLSAAQQGLRPRELDRRARKDVLALLARNGLALGGLDLMIPHRDWLAAATQDRAFEAMLGTLELAYDLGKVPVTTTLPVEKMDDAMVRELLTAADARGVAIAVHAEHDLNALHNWLKQHDQPMLGAAIDPAALLSQDIDPAEAITRFAERLLVARLDDHTATSVASAGGRCLVGEGSLDVLGYRAALSICRRLRSIIIELRDLPDPAAAARTAVQAWSLDGAL